MSSESLLLNKKIFVTGGTGTIGSEVVRRLLSEGAVVTVYSRDQNKQFKMNHDLENENLTFINGDICDREILKRNLVDHWAVVHCAASKHVPLCEQNPDSAVKINVEGTRNVLLTAQESGVKRLLLLSTDKAANPTSVMGATKLLAERLCLEFNKSFPCSVVRLGNVFASNGSVVPTFQDRIKKGLPLDVYHPTAVRYFCTIQEIGAFIVERLKDMTGGEIFVKKMKCMTIAQLAECMRPTEDYPIRVTSLTRGEKVKEQLITQDESKLADERDGYVVIKEKGKPPSPEVQFFTNDEIKEMLRSVNA